MFLKSFSTCFGSTFLGLLWFSKDTTDKFLTQCSVSQCKKAAVLTVFVSLSLLNLKKAGDVANLLH